MDNPRGNQGKSRGRGRGNNAQGGGDNRQNRSQPAQPPSGTAWGPPPGNSARGNARGGGGGSGRGRASAAPTEYQGAPSMRGRGNGNGQNPLDARAQSNEMPANSAWAGRGGASAAPAGRGRGQPQTGPQIVQPSAAPAWGGNQAAASTGAIPRQQQQAPSAPVPVQERPQQAAAPSEVSRGAVRGRRVLPELIRTRPQNCVTKAGAEGTRVLLQTNYFVVRKRPEWSIGQYRVDFSPEVENVRVRRAYLAHHKVLLGGYIFDGTVLFTCTNLKEQMRDGYLELITRNREGEVIQIKIKHVGSVSATDATQIHVLNLILRRSMEGLNLQELSRNYYDPQAKICIRQYNLEIWPGYQTSVRQHEKDILLCAEIMHKVLRTDTVYNILMECTNNARGDYQNAFKAQVIGMVVLTDYNNKTYRVDDVDFSSTPLSTFSQRDQQVSYVQYYRERYNIQVRDHKQPMLISRPTEKTIRGGSDQLIVLIPELCRATGMTDSMRNDFHLMKAMSEHTRLAPDMRIERLRTFNRRLKETAESMSVLRSWNMDLDSNLLELPGRILKPQLIVFGNNRRYQCDDRADWTREFRNNSMFKHIDLKRWYVIVPRKNVAEIQNFVGMCIQAAAGMKMVIAQPTYLEIPDNRTGSYSQAIDNAVSNDIQMVMLTLVTQDVERYSCIKKKCCVDRPVPSQVVTLRTVAPRGAKAAGLMSVATKVVIQMNAKIMGAPWSVELPLEGLMTVGFDVCHSAREKNKSFGALVATMDINKSAKYYSNVTKHEKGEELSQEIAMSMAFALKTYDDTHGTLPKFIMFYRDGVGDGQLHQVLQSEISAMKAKLIEIYKSKKSPFPPRFCFVIVSKRINTRYFMNGKNPPPGTVVDDIITLPERYDFFLVSQSVRQGTVSPTNYNVIFDTMGLAPDRIQQLTYKMTHLYYNWSGTCRVPAVCQYAHKLAFLVAESIHRAPSNVLEKQLYFL